LDAAIACSLPSDALEQRLAWIRRVTANSLLTHRLVGTTLRLLYREDALPDLQKIIAQERECCPFLEYSLRPAEGALQLTIGAPDGLGSDARWLFDQFLPQAAAVSKKSCGCAPGACG
jgi:hypothetical protein